MEKLIFYRKVLIGILLLVFGTQLLLCRKAGRVLVKLIPTLLILLLQGICFCMYAAGGFTNWAWLILLLLLLGPLAADGAAWAVFGIRKAIDRRQRRNPSL